MKRIVFADGRGYLMIEESDRVSVRMDGDGIYLDGSSFGMPRIEISDIKNLEDVCGGPI